MIVFLLRLTDEFIVDSLIYVDLVVFLIKMGSKLWLIVLILLSIPLVFGSELNNTETLTPPEIFSNVEDYYQINGDEGIIIRILKFNSEEDLENNLNLSLEKVDLKNIKVIEKNSYVVYNNFVEWTSGEYLIHIESDEGSEFIVKNILFNNYSKQYGSDLEKFIDNQEIQVESFASARSFQMMASSPCDDCGAGLFNICDQTECWALASTCWFHGFNSCSDGSSLYNGHDDYCVYKDQRLGGCARNEYDCDSDNQCKSGLKCVGTLLGEDGCCNDGEEWNQNSHQCSEIQDSKTNLTYTFGDIKYGLYRGKWNQGPICVVCPPYVWSPGEIDYTKRPVLLVHGWGNSASELEFGPKNEWGNFQNELENQGYQVWRLQYSPANASNKEIAGMIEDAIDKLLSYGYDSNFNKLDVVSHSMGGLAVRGYIQGMAETKYGGSISYKNNIRKYVILASPMGGSFYANAIDGLTDLNIVTNHPYCQDLIEGDYPMSNGNTLLGGTDATREMQIGSDYTWELNTDSFNYNVDYITIAGRKTLSRASSASELFNMEYCLSNGWEINDGVVSLYSSSLINKNVPIILVDRFHISTWDLLSEEVGISDSARVAKLSSHFFKETLNSATADTILNTLGNSGEFYYNPLSSQELPYQLEYGGGVVVEVEKSEINLNSLSLRPTYSQSGYTMYKNTWTDRWYYSALSDSTNNYILFMNILPSQNYIPVINNLDFSEIISIEDGVPNMIELNLDKDNDGYDLESIGGSDCNDYDYSIKPGAGDSSCNGIDNDCDDAVDEDFVESFVSCGVGECYSEGSLSCQEGVEVNTCIPNEPIEEICDELDNDCDGEIDEEGICDIIEPETDLIINSPILDLFDNRRILLNLQTTEEVDEIVYTYFDSRGRERETRLCRNCDEYNRERSFSDGDYELIFKTIVDDVSIDEESVSFLIDSKDPRISKTSPTRGFSDGNFYVEFKEDNPVNLTLYYGNSIRIKDLDIGNDCSISRGKYSCSVWVNLTDFDNQEIEYWFELEDIAGNKDESRKREVNVDMTFPVLNNPDDFWEMGTGRYDDYVYFDMSITEKNFDKVILSYDYRGRTKEKRLCSRLRYGKCETKFKLRDGYTNYQLIIRDDAGNAVVKPIDFS